MMVHSLERNNNMWPVMLMPDNELLYHIPNSYSIVALL